MALPFKLLLKKEVILTSVKMSAVFPALHLSLLVLQQDSGVFSSAFLPVVLYHADFDQSDGPVTPQHFNCRKTQQSAMSLPCSKSEQWRI